MMNKDEYIKVFRDKLLPSCGEILSPIKEAAVTQ